jgi:uncharacterized protein YqgQ
VNPGYLEFKAHCQAKIDFMQADIHELYNHKANQRKPNKQQKAVRVNIS